MINNLLAGGYTSIEQMSNSISKPKSKDAKTAVEGSASFQEIFNQKKSINEAVANASEEKMVKFSKHADNRLKQRDIVLTEEQLSRLNAGADKAGAKGIKESLVLLDDMAFIVNTQNKTVVTAMDQNMNEENIFTNIDGAVII